MGSDGIVPSNIDELLEGSGALGRLLREDGGSMVDAIVKLVHQSGGAVLEPRADGASLLHRFAFLGLYDGVKALWERGAKPSILLSDDSTLLHSAVRAGDSTQDQQRANILSLFLNGSSRGVSFSVDKRNSKGWTALKLAARKGLERSVETLLEHGADPNVPDNERYLPLHNSVSHHAILKLLVSSRHPQNINAQTEKGETPLYLSVESGNVESAVTLLEHQADPNITNREGISPLFLAARGGNVDLVRVLLKNNAHVNVTGASQNIAPLHWAAHKEFTEIALLLIEYGADVQLKDKEGRTPIGLAAPELASRMLELARRRNPHLSVSPLSSQPVISAQDKAFNACGSGNVQALQALLQAGLNVNLTKDGTSTTLLHLGAYCGQVGIVAMLLNNGANWQLVDKDGDTVLHYACMNKSPEGQGNHESTLSYLLSTPCATLINSQNSRGDTPLLVTIRCCYFDRARILLKHNADTTIRNAKNELPLHRACCGDCNIGIVLQLAEVFTDLDLRDKDGWTPLMFAARSKSPAIVHYLLQRGVDPNHQQSVGLTALHLAVQENQLNICQLLLKYKANPNIPGGPQSLTPLHIAAHKSFKDICLLLSDNGADISVQDKDGDTPLALTNDPSIKESITSAHVTYEDRMRERSNSHPTTPPPCMLYSLFRRDSKKEKYEETNCRCQDMVMEKEECLKELVIKIKTLQFENEYLHSRLKSCEDELKQRELSDKICGLDLWDEEEEEGGKEAGTKVSSKPWWLVGEHEIKMSDEAINTNWESFQKFFDVYLGTFRSIDVVVKKINRPPDVWECCNRKTFQKEVEQLSRLQCPHVVQFMGAIMVPSSGLYCLVMEYLPNNDLHTLMHVKKTQFSKLEKTQIIRDIAAGMAYLHSFPIIHRNLIPSNVLITEKMNAKVSDFGLYNTKVQTNFYGDLRKHCLKDGNKRPYYRAPEVIEKNEFSTASDVYSFGIMLHELATQKRPFSDVDFCCNAMVWVMKLLMGARPVIPSYLEPSCKQMMARLWHADPSMRPTFKEFLCKCEEKLKAEKEAATADTADTAQTAQEGSE